MNPRETEKAARMVNRALSVLPKPRSFDSLKPEPSA